MSRLNKVFNKVLAYPDIVASMTAEGTKPIPQSPAAFEAMIRDDTRDWGEAIRSLNLVLN